MYNRNKKYNRKSVRSIFFLGALLIIACYTCMCKEKIKIKCNNTKSNAFIFAFYTPYTSSLQILKKIWRTGHNSDFLEIVFAIVFKFNQKDT